MPEVMSLPTRERGLKLEWYKLFLRLRKSLPTRERGLKCILPHIVVRVSRSLPTRERGLKSRKKICNDSLFGRSLHGSVD